jgi:hypothetical protein
VQVAENPDETLLKHIFSVFAGRGIAEAQGKHLAPEAIKERFLCPAVAPDTRFKFGFRHAEYDISVQWLP